MVPYYLDPMELDSIADIIRTDGTDRSDRIALEYEGRSISFGELDRRSSQVANALRSAGIGPQDCVAFVDKNGPEYFEVAFGIAKLNAINVGVNWRLTPGEMTHIINDAQAKVLVVGPEFVSHIETIEGDLSTVTTIVVIGRHDRWTDYEPWVA